MTVCSKDIEDIRDSIEINSTDNSKLTSPDFQEKPLETTDNINAQTTSQHIVHNSLTETPVTEIGNEGDGSELTESSSISSSEPALGKDIAEMLDFSCGTTPIEIITEPISVIGDVQGNNFVRI